MAARDHATALLAARRAQRLLDLGVRVAQRIVQRPPAPAVPCVRVGAGGEQVDHHSEPAFSRGEVQRGATVVVAAVDREALLLAQVDDLREYR
jgi:hypothetical protein